MYTLKINFQQTFTRHFLYIKDKHLFINIRIYTRKKFAFRKFLMNDEQRMNNK